MVNSTGKPSRQTKSTTFFECRTFLGSVNGSSLASIHWDFLVWSHINIIFYFRWYFPTSRNDGCRERIPSDFSSTDGPFEAREGRSYWKCGNIQVSLPTNQWSSTDQPLRSFAIHPDDLERSSWSRMTVEVIIPQVQAKELASACELVNIIPTWPTKNISMWAC